MTASDAMAATVVSVIVPAFNAEAYLGECLESVQRQTGNFVLDVIVVDDGSTDDTARVASQTPGVRCLRQPNLGPSAARNAGLAVARGEFIAWLDADDFWPDGKLARQLDILLHHHQVALVFGDCRQFDAAGPHPSTLFEAGGFGAVAWGPGPLLPDAYDRLLEENVITTGTVVIRRDVLLALGGFAEDLRLVEDLDLWLRVARRFPIAWCADVCLLRRRHSANTSRDALAMSEAYLEVLRRQYESERNRRDGRSARIRALAVAEWRRLARSALASGRVRLGLRHAWHALASPWGSAKCDPDTEMRR